MRARFRGLASVLLLFLAAGCSATRTTVRDLQGQPIDPLRMDGASAVVLLFADTECPISNAYAPEVRRLHTEFEAQGARFVLVYADPGRSLEELRAHVAAFDYRLSAVWDAQHELVRRSGAAITPEACVFRTDGTLVYRGRIDDRYVDFGKQRVAPTSRDLHDALEAVLAGRLPERPWAPAIGCAIAALQ